MRAVAHGVSRAVAAAVLVLLAAGPAAAVDFSLAVYADGVRIDDGNVDETRLGCVDNPDGVSAVCNAEDLNYGGTYAGVQIDIVDFFIDNDPVVTGTLGVTNLQSTTQQFTFVFTLPVSSMPTTVTGGSFRGSVTDADGSGNATVATGSGIALYTALLDNANWQTLYPAVTSFSTTSSSNIPQTAFGQPIPSLPGPAVNSSIGIRIDFSLTGFDQASFTSNHVVQVPEPGTAALLGVGLALFAVRRRR